jgi:hypothetical protein
VTSVAPVLPPAGPPGEILLDFAALRAAALLDLERLAGPDWTDFNSHDPGITLLEALCYALTDFGYRLFHPVQDLLATPPGAAPATSVLRGPVESLSGRAVTTEDLRALAIDVAGVRNAWIEPARAPATSLAWHDAAAARILVAPADAPPPGDVSVLALAGLHRVLIEPSGGVVGGDGLALARAVAARLHAHRGLGEDFEEITVLGSFPVALDLALELTEQASGEMVLRAVAARIDDFFSPAIPRRGLVESLADTATDRLAEGPAPERGFPDRARLAGAVRHRAVHRSDLIREIVAVDGVRAVRTLAFLDAPAGAWSLVVPDLAVPRLSRQGSHVSVYSPRAAAGLPLDFPAEVAVAAEAALPVDPARDLPPPAGRWRDPGAYRPIQAELPVAYGVGSGTLAASTPAARRAESSRLRAYLVFFDQLLASYFAELAALPALLAPGRAPGSAVPGYPAGVVPDERPNALSPAVLDPALDPAAVAALIEPAGAPAALRRRNAVLNHLLARFAETFANDPLDEVLIAAKERFLEALPELTAARGTGIDLLAPPAAPADPPLLRRLMLELDLQLDDAERPLLIEHMLLRPLPEDATQDVPLLTLVPRPDPFSLQVTLLLPARLKAEEMRIAPALRAAVPAHLVTWLRWLDPPAMQAAIAAYEDWIATRRRQLRRRFGLAEEG